MVDRWLGLVKGRLRVNYLIEGRSMVARLMRDRRTQSALAEDSLIFDLATVGVYYAYEYSDIRHLGCTGRGHKLINF